MSRRFTDTASIFVLLLLPLKSGFLFGLSPDWPKYKISKCKDYPISLIYLVNSSITKFNHIYLPCDKILKMKYSFQYYRIKYHLKSRTSFNS